MRSRTRFFLQVLIIFGLCLSMGGGLASGKAGAGVVLAEFSAGEHLRQTALEVLAIAPDAAVNDVDQPVVITGEGFSATPQVFLGDHELLEVSFNGPTELEAVVPWGLTAGVYDLRVVNPDEEEMVKSEAFTVTDGLGDFITAGPYGGQAVQLALQDGNPSTVYALMWGAGLFISEDGGENWTRRSEHDWPIQIDFDAVNPEILYLGVNSNELYRSDDNGRSWVPTVTEIHAENGCFVTYPAAHPSKGGTVYFGMGSCGSISLENDEGGVYYSDNYGKDGWEPRNTGLTDLDIQSLAIYPDGETLVAGTYSGKIFYSEDGGMNWHEGAQLELGITRVFINPYVPKQAYAITRDDLLGMEPDKKIYKSDDLINWTEITTIEIHHGGGSSQAQMAFTPDAIWLASDKLYKSMDNGVNWTQLDDVTDWSLYAIAISPGPPEVIYLGDDFGIKKRTDGGGEWTDVTNNLAALVPRALAVSSSDMNLVYVKTHQGIFKSTDAGNSWQYLAHGISGFPGGSLLALGIENDQILYYTNGCKGKFCLDISTDGGLTWPPEPVTSPLPPEFKDRMCESFTIRPVPLTPERVIVGASVVDPETNDFEGIFYYSDDQGLNWDYFLPEEPIDRITEIEYDPSDPTLLYAATYSSSLWRSEDGGLSWEPIPVGDPALEPPVRVEAIATHPNDADKVFVRVASTAVTDNPNPELWVSADRGETWSQLEYDFMVSVDLIFSPPLPGQAFYNLYTGCEGGLCRSVDDGLEWTENNSVPQPEILASATDGERSILYMGTPGGLVNTANTLETAGMLRSGFVSGGGVYRLTNVLPIFNFNFYLPIVRGGTAP